MLFSVCYIILFFSHLRGYREFPLDNETHLVDTNLGVTYPLGAISRSAYKLRSLVDNLWLWQDSSAALSDRERERNATIWFLPLRKENSFNTIKYIAQTLASTVIIRQSLIIFSLIYIGIHLSLWICKLNHIKIINEKLMKYTFRHKFVLENNDIFFKSIGCINVWFFIVYKRNQA